MKQDSTEERTFIHLSRAWYGPANLGANSRYVDEVYFTGPGGRGELMMRWYELRDERPPAPHLEVFDDSWAALAGCTDVIARMGALDDKSITPETFCQLLRQLGYRDVTPEDEDKRASLQKKVQALIDEERGKK